MHPIWYKQNDELHDFYFIEKGALEINKKMHGLEFYSKIPEQELAISINKNGIKLEKGKYAVGIVGWSNLQNYFYFSTYTNKTKIGLFWIKNHLHKHIFTFEIQNQETLFMEIKNKIVSENDIPYLEIRQIYIIKISDFD